MFHRFKWTSVSHRRNSITAEYEPLQPYFLLAAMELAGCRTFADVGANIGAYSLFASQVPTIERLVAFEASAAPAEELERNLAANAVEARVVRRAVSDRAGTVSFGIASRYAGNSAVVDDASGSGRFAETVTVEATTLDAELAECPYPMALKIDVEGHEPAVIDGARAILTGGACVVQIEAYAPGVDDRLAGLGYRRLTAIGPDNYFTNIPDLEPAALFEAAARLLIAANHENKQVTWRWNGLGIELSGAAYERARQLAQRVLGKRL